MCEGNFRSVNSSATWNAGLLSTAGFIEEPTLLQAKGGAARGATFL